MSWQDLTNGSFEVLGGLCAWLNVLALRQDQNVRGVNELAVAVFTVWGFWNLYYYPSLGQWASFAGGLVIVTANVAWVALAIKYRRN